MEYDVLAPAQIDPDGIYHDGQARLLLGLSEATLRRARKSRLLQHTRQGSRIIYRGQWLLDWLVATSQGGAK